MRAIKYLLLFFVSTGVAHARVVESDYVFALPSIAPHEQISGLNSFENSAHAINWLTLKSFQLKKVVNDDQYRLRLLRTVHYEARRANLDPNLVLAIIDVESRFKQHSVSSVGATGVMQVMPFWKKLIGRIDDSLFDIQTNLRYGCNILSFYLELEKGNLTNALARYNGSLGSNFYPSLVFTALQKYKED
jgi:soluble lytic murein transglycosylase-like protein